MAQGPPSSDSEDPDGIREYQYESEGEEALSRRAQSLFHEAGQDYRLARATLLAYTRPDFVYVSQSHGTTGASHVPRRPHTTPPSSPVILSHDPAPRSFLRTKNQLHTNKTTKTEPIPPSPTSPPRRSQAITDSPSLKSGLGVGLMNQGRTPSNQRPRSTQPSSSTQQPHNMTLIYPSLVEAGMASYFKVNDGVSYRSRQDVQEILTRIRQDEQWLGECHHVDTSAAGPNGIILIHRPPEDTASTTWYSVTAGTQVGVFTSWEVAAAYTQGISKSVYRLWCTRAEAYRSIQLALVLGTLRLLPSP